MVAGSKTKQRSENEDLELVALWISRYQASRGAMEKSAHELRFLLSAAGFFAAGGLILTLCEILTNPAAVAQWAVAKTLVLCTVLVVAYGLFLSCISWMSGISGAYSKLSEVVNTHCSLALSPNAYAKLATFAAAENTAGTGWKLFGARVETKALVVI
jgi:hypothetical protein